MWPQEQGYKGLFTQQTADGKSCSESYVESIALKEDSNQTGNNCLDTANRSAVKWVADGRNPVTQDKQASQTVAAPQKIWAVKLSPARENTCSVRHGVERNLNRARVVEEADDTEVTRWSGADHLAKSPGLSCGPCTKNGRLREGTTR